MVIRMHKDRQKGAYASALLARFAWWFACGLVFAPRVWDYVQAGRIGSAVILAAVAWLLIYCGSMMFPDAR